jgi:tetraacyldisaccharide 4'-kinase
MSSPLPAWLDPLTRPVSRVYGWAVARRNARFDRSIGIDRITLPVVSVGNITTGGTGKTPMVAWIARMLIEQRLQPVIAMRGYRAKPGEMSDEQAEYRDLLPEVSVLANPERIKALRDFLPTHPQVNCVLLDDGFQHRQIHRDLDLVLVDASAGTFSERLLPAGHLREPIANLARAHGAIVTRASDATESQISKLKSHIERHHGKLPLAITSHRWNGLSLYQGESQPTSQPLEWLRGRRLLTLLGIGNPAAVVRQLESHGAMVSVSVPCRDHERFGRAKLATARGLCDGLDAMFVTGKDWVKLRSLPMIHDWPVPIVVPRLEIAFIEGEAALRELIMCAAGSISVRWGDAR